MRKFKAIDLFCGAGGFSLAALNAGIEVVAAIDNDKNSCKTYRNNFIEKKKLQTLLVEGDMLSITPMDVMIAARLSEGECDIIVGGPPCQGFSAHRLDQKAINDPRNKLLIRYFDFVKTIRPKMFLVENVPGMLWPRHSAWIEKFYALATAAGYNTFKPVIMNAKDYGVPQNRKRVFILGIREDMPQSIEWPIPATHFSPTSSEVLLDGRTPWLAAQEVFNIPLSATDKNAGHMKHSEALISVFNATPINGGSRKDSGRILACHSDHNGHKDVYGRINPAVPGPTMTTACINPSKGRFVHPTDPHGITARHAARFQTFPEWFTFEGGLMAAGKQIGNAVPVLFGEVILKHLSKALDRKNTHNNNEIVTKQEAA